MTNNVAISINQIGKKYIVGRNKDSSLRGTLSNILKVYPLMEMSSGL